MKILTQEQKDFINRACKEEFKEFLAKGVSEENGTFRVIASTMAKDRHGEIIDQNGWDLTNFLKNPVILLNHRMRELPIGIATNAFLEDGKLIIEGVFASKEANPKAQQVRKLHDEGIMNAVSVGFITKERDGNLIKEAELLELSFVTIPANPEALAKMKEVGIETLDMSLLSFGDEKADEKKKEDEKKGAKADMAVKVEVDTKKLEELSKNFKENIIAPLIKRIEDLEGKKKSKEEADLKIKQAIQSIDKIAEGALSIYKAQRSER